MSGISAAPANISPETVTAKFRTETLANCGQFPALFSLSRDRIIAGLGPETPGKRAAFQPETCCCDLKTICLEDQVEVAIHYKLLSLSGWSVYLSDNFRRVSIVQCYYRLLDHIDRQPAQQLAPQSHRPCRGHHYTNRLCRDVLSICPLHREYADVEMA